MRKYKDEAWNRDSWLRGKTAKSSLILTNLASKSSRVIMKIQANSHDKVKDTLSYVKLMAIGHDWYLVGQNHIISHHNPYLFRIHLLSGN